MEKISLDMIIKNTKIDQVEKLTFVHDCDLSDENLIRESLSNATVLFYTNHLCKKNKKIINSFCSKIEDLRKLSQNTENYYSILICDIEIDVDVKIKENKKLLSML